jgi:tRNA U34 2-thiouridine synthase MnmA/TrmU
MTDSNTTQAFNLTALTPEQLATLLTNAYRRQITAEQVRAVAEEGNLLTAGDTINLIHYTAFLAGK